LYGFPQRLRGHSAGRGSVFENLTAPGGLQPPYSNGSFEVQRRISELESSII